MTKEHETGMALADRETQRLQHSQELIRGEIKTPQEYAERIRQLQGQAHILSPMAAVSYIAPQHVVTPMIVVIDPSVDPESGRGADVYHQRAIHKGQGRGDQYRPIEVSLNKIALQKILQAAGVNVHPPAREFRERYWWIVTSYGDMLSFDGQRIALPPGTASLDLRDGSADIGEWTPEAWAEKVRVSEEQKKRVKEDERWKVKPEPINGWTHQRVIQQRSFGLEIAESKSLNRLARNLSIKQVYTIAELQKPFVIFRASYVPDLSNPEVARMYAAQNLGARMALYPGSSQAAPVSHAMGDPTTTFEGEALRERTDEDPERMKTAAPPEDVEEVSFEEPQPEAPKDQFHVTKVSKTKGEERYFVETAEGVTLYTPDKAIAQALAKASKDGLTREIPTERILIDSKPYRQVIEVIAVGGLKL